MGQSGVDIDRALVKASETTEKCFLTRSVTQFLKQAGNVNSLGNEVKSG